MILSGYLGGKFAGERGPDGVYPDGTVNAAVQERLEELAKKVKSFVRDEAGSPNGRGKRATATTER